MGLSLSCQYLHHALYLLPDSLWHCCITYVRNGEVRGFAEIQRIESAADISAESILKHKKLLYDDINAGQETACTGCPFLKYDHWAPLDRLEIRVLGLYSHTRCNMRCSYCTEDFYSGKEPLYDIIEVCEKLEYEEAFGEIESLQWGGGEAVLLKGFDKTFTSLTNKLKPAENAVYTNAIRHNAAVEAALLDGRVKTITSVDAGTRETFKRVRGVDQFESVLQNLERYSRAGGEAVTVKYILLPENNSLQEIEAFVARIKSHGLERCCFVISTNHFQAESLDKSTLEAARSLHRGLRALGIPFVTLDALSSHWVDLASWREVDGMRSYQNLIIWGTGGYARAILEKGLFDEETTIRFFVDNNPDRVGQRIDRYEIRSPNCVLENDYPIFIAASPTFYRAIHRQLMGMGVSETRIVDETFLGPLFQPDR